MLTAAFKIHSLEKELAEANFRSEPAKYRLHEAEATTLKLQSLLDANLGKFNKETSQLKSTLTDYQKENDDLQSTATELSAHEIALKEMLASDNEEIGTLRTQLNEVLLKESISHKKEEISNCRVQELTVAIRDLEEKMPTSSSDSTALGQLSTENAQLQVDISELQRT